MVKPGNTDDGSSSEELELEDLDIDDLDIPQDFIDSLEEGWNELQRSSMVISSEKALSKRSSSTDAIDQILGDYQQSPPSSPRQSSSSDSDDKQAAELHEEEKRREPDDKDGAENTRNIKLFIEAQAEFNETLHGYATVASKGDDALTARVLGKMQEFFDELRSDIAEAGNKDKFASLLESDVLNVERLFELVASASFLECKGVASGLREELAEKLWVLAEDPEHSLKNLSKVESDAKSKEREILGRSGVYTHSTAADAKSFWQDRVSGQDRDKGKGGPSVPPR